MTNKQTLSQADLIKQTFNVRRYRENDLFHEYNQNPFFWKLSDLALLYPNFFDVKKPFSQKTVNRMNATVFATIPEFEQLTERPVHILTVKEPYNLYNPKTEKIQRVKKGKDQHLTNIACEYLFRQLDGAELEQAYFLYPERPAHELLNAAKDLKFEKIRDRIAQTSNLLSAVINRAYGADKSSFRKIWSLIWETLYNAKTMDILRERHNIKTSPIDYMKPQTLIFINGMLQEIVFTFSNKPSYTIADIYRHAKEKASMARAKFFQYGSSPEKQLVEKSTYSTIKRIRDNRKYFWYQNYPLSLMQR